ncbi:MAG: tRNA (N6-threonylcarbamoyladenosine(37)-N6)-methyltransferase TrmO [Dehalococcoidia bacterium]
MELTPIGIIHSPFTTMGQAPFQGCESEETSVIEVFHEYAQGLRDIEGFSHLIVLYWCHKSAGFSLLVQTPWDPTPHGVFASRSPRRPNPLGLSVVRLVAQQGNVLKVKELDAIDGTPVLDIKPYVPRIDGKADAQIGWLQDRLGLRDVQS